MSLESQKLSTFSPKIAEISLDLLESRRISPNMVEISWKSAWISSNLARNQFGSPRISSDFTKYGRDLIEISLDLLESLRISSNLNLILPELLDLYITSVGLGGSGFGEENPPLDPPASGLGRKNPSPTNGSVGSG